ncbi:MAG: helix-turn-helix domain-containing protein [Salana multivorans]|uniref:helix-turn-helix domain-containing protein n=1 Tax=Salana multivorans TaxID=120377 RepID=UPI0009593A8F|nr:helix-turn-helix domain-containing protein [Salana multivorans]MBN8883004.1 helix-turn-helix domain-containing protein [Salana multivorans]OJX94044.1 MAG: hypothetical protein BGO96_09565 [Micrococcales bacterium 73-15]
MGQDIKRLGAAVSARRRELGLSQEDVQRLGGPSTTTLSKIENGTAKRIWERTARDLDRVLGWRAESALDVLYGLGDPLPAPEPTESRVPAEATEGNAVAAPEFDGDEYMRITTTVDESGEMVIVGASSAVDAEGVRSLVEVRYWPGSDRRSVRMPMVAVAVGETHRALLDATSHYREPVAGEAYVGDERIGADGYPEPTTTREAGVPDGDSALESQAEGSSASSDGGGGVVHFPGRRPEQQKRAARTARRTLKDTGEFEPEVDPPAPED